MARLRWRENGYAIGFPTGGPFGPGHTVARVNYDSALHRVLAAKVASASIRFFREGLQKRGGSGEDWEKEFPVEWDTMLSYLSPMVKHADFKGENEYRVVHQLQQNEFPNL